jgi:hypothetical protein
MTCPSPLQRLLEGRQLLLPAHEADQRGHLNRNLRF